MLDLGFLMPSAFFRFLYL